ncbi:MULTISPECIES: DHH family phosphoesterase [Paenibacillus]|uniref:Phosphoesterase RecJ domain protein n=2 Tax=Paenibacillus lactis TaxID=228574 RepID=G4HBK2_9BACL|nr:bifunctional oligoribonuclease/PAP phosphatase NrnA [Paenibacillus lactis]EHB67311.1 phosphoesterase RecJ domain protein [Paenibacillus lactis 154]MBP1894566.1 phosphoesterase RecJ-like protein [Paenibacillus lactis]MCM3496056.1 bifunctional oligoribonuclease/PAP phosphatase NrnA [Paenibacillus lactis]GIO93340.1 phosphoesterase [Paenibacillus lactis]HAF98586.1 bifunctional oligoribonuclease/PAP phosphatase NrnA [Paenibacillus lactis]
MQTYEQELQQVKSFLLEHDDYLVVSHVQPDGDAVSSTLAVGWLLSCLGKKFTMINEGPIPKRMNMLWHAEDIINGSEELPDRTFTHVICVDCADFARVGHIRTLFAENARIVNIDHHPTNDRYGSVNLVLPQAAATAEILYDLLNVCGITWDAEIATSVYTGLLTDTGGFRYTNTSPKVMSIASELLGHGVNGPELAEILLEEMTLPQMKVLVEALNTLQVSEDGKIAWVHVTPDHMERCGAASEDLEGIVNYPRNIQGVEVGILFKLLKSGIVKVSLRSAGKVDVAALAQGFGGGGHVRAAGCSLEGPLEDVIPRVVEQVRLRL